MDLADVGLRDLCIEHLRCSRCDRVRLCSQTHDVDCIGLSSCQFGGGGGGGGGGGDRTALYTIL
jgi:hypothetical protein